MQRSVGNQMNVVITSGSHVASGTLSESELSDLLAYAATLCLPRTVIGWETESGCLCYVMFGADLSDLIGQARSLAGKVI
jgi:hypothetical protein